MRRKPGNLLPLELAICASAVDLRRRGVEEFHGYEIAKSLADGNERRLLTAYGTLYRALVRLQNMGFLESRWEAPDIPARENRPGRRLYRLTASGESTLQDLLREWSKETSKRARRRLAPA